jgi:osmotically-inducible protein OsmY
MNRAKSLVALVGSFMLLTSAAFAADPTVSDGQITSQVVSAVRAIGPDIVQRLQVTTKDGVVTLGGRVRSVQSMAKALAAAESVPGVSKVLNRMSVTQ